VSKFQTAHDQLQDIYFSCNSREPKVVTRLLIAGDKQVTWLLNRHLDDKKHLDGRVETRVREEHI